MKSRGREGEDSYCDDGAKHSRGEKSCHPIHFLLRAFSMGPSRPRCALESGDRDPSSSTAASLCPKPAMVQPVHPVPPRMARETRESRCKTGNSLRPVVWRILVRVYARRGENVRANLDDMLNGGMVAFLCHAVISSATKTVQTASTHDSEDVQVRMQNPLAQVFEGIQLLELGTLAPR